MFDLGKDLIKTLIFFLSCMFIGVSLMMALIASNTFVLIMVPLLLVILAVVGIILTFIPFFKDKLWLIPIAQIIAASAVALIVHFI
jgi:hypothetical protein